MADEPISSVIETLQEKVYALRNELDTNILAQINKEKEYRETLNLLRETQWKELESNKAESRLREAAPISIET